MSLALVPASEVVYVKFKIKIITSNSAFIHTALSPLDLCSSSKAFSVIKVITTILKSEAYDIKLYSTSSMKNLVINNAV